MLVLTRRVGQSLVVTVQDHVLKVKVVDIHGHQVVLGFEANTEVKIMREELGVRP